MIPTAENQLESIRAGGFSSGGLILDDSRLRGTAWHRLGPGHADSPPETSSGGPWRCVWLVVGRENVAFAFDLSSCLAVFFRTSQLQ